MGGFVNGLAGFGTALFALGWWLQIMSPLQAVAIVLATSVISGLPGLRLVWNHIQPRLLLRFLIPALVGIPLGTYFLAIISSQVMMLLVAIFMFAYGAFFSLRSALPKVDGDHPIVDRCVGLIAGVLGGMAGLSGALPTMWLSMRPWEKNKTRGILQPFNMTILGVAIAGAWLQGGYTIVTLKFLLFAFPATAIGTLCGIQIYRRISDSLFRRMLIILMLLSGIGLFIRIWLS
ncbi:MAG: sulfite exporter TauE/SafE family protein [Rhizobiaceae bacterium]